MGLTDDFLVGAINEKQYKWKKTSEPKEIWDLKFSRVTQQISMPFTIPSY